MEFTDDLLDRRLMVNMDAFKKAKRKDYKRNHLCMSGMWLFMEKEKNKSLKIGGFKNDEM